MKLIILFILFSSTIFANYAEYYTQASGLEPKKSISDSDFFRIIYNYIKED